MKIEIFKKSIISFILSTFLLYTGCATIFSGGKDDIDLSSEPTGAKVFVNGLEKGKTPLRLHLKKGKEYGIEFKMDGYQSRNFTLSYSLGAGWLILDILCGLVGIIVDAATGNWNGFDYDAYKATLEPAK